MTDSLLQRLHAAPSGSRALSDEVLLALGWTHTHKGQETWWMPPGDPGPVYADEARPSPSESVDDVRALAHSLDMEIYIDEIEGDAGVWHCDRLGQWVRLTISRDDDGPFQAALGLCEVIVQAHEAKESGNG